MSLISAVTRKRKKCLSAHLQGSSTDEDSEHEPVKASNYGAEEGGGGGGGEEEGKERGEEDKGDRTDPDPVKWDEKENRVKAEETTEVKDQKVGEEASGKDPRDRKGKGDPRFVPSQQQMNTTNSRPSPVTNPPSRYRPHNPARGRPPVPFWISPTRPPNICHGPTFYGNQHPDWNQSAPVRYRKTRGGRTRAVSMNLDVEFGRSDDRVRGWRAERVEVVRVIDGTSGQRGPVGVPQGSISGPQSIDPLPRLPKEAPSFSTSASGVIEQNPAGPSAVVLRRSALDPRDTTRRWRRHTVVV
ncbi:rho GTPase-activating protein 23-like isoform X3 [Xyrichtys novacula]|uniref:Rho GTPase-activating protein 23-like isoform X3 n=1 Tax=Xyrichtys novacula TaxID=13765 RepID=A0AAV1H3H1_XYRNO|nr:rho GTPase-activating protein 23-like isoform X3 [Xyrichtys novacula]